jgi:histone H3/H4
MSYIVKKAIQDYAKKKNVQVGGDFYAAVDKKIEHLLDGAVKRCGENKRKTLKAYDI